MKISLGYLKDVIAFISSIITLILLYICGFQPSIHLIPIIAFLIFIFDGLFTIFPYLHTHTIDLG